MSNSSELSPNVVSLLRAIAQEGSVDQLIHHLQLAAGTTSPGDFELVHSEGGGAMSDAAKRRLDEEVLQGPVSGAKRSGNPDDKKKDVKQKSIPLPSGIQDLQHWGDIVLNHGKLGKFRNTYREIVTSEEKEKKDYCNCARQQKSRDDFTPPMKDFIQYVLAWDESECPHGITYPGSSIPRVMREW